MRTSTYRKSGIPTISSLVTFTPEADENTCSAVDGLSPSERAKSKDSKTFIDVQELIEQVSGVRFFRISTEQSLDPLAANRTYQYELRTDSCNVDFIVLSDGQLRKPTRM